jgi:hypothetical protein
MEKTMKNIKKELLIIPVLAALLACNLSATQTATPTISPTAVTSTTLPKNEEVSRMMPLSSDSAKLPIDFIVLGFDDWGSTDGWTTGKLTIGFYKFSKEGVDPLTVEFTSGVLTIKEDKEYPIPEFCWDISPNEGYICMQSMPLSIDPLNGRRLPNDLLLAQMDISLVYPTGTTPTRVVVETNYGTLFYDLDINRDKNMDFNLNQFAYKSAQPFSALVALEMSGSDKINFSLDNCVQTYTQFEDKGMPYTAVNSNAYDNETISVLLSIGENYGYHFNDSRILPSGPKVYIFEATPLTFSMGPGTQKEGWLEVNDTPDFIIHVEEDGSYSLFVGPDICPD